MKRKFKLIVPSFLTLIFCLLLIAGSTFAIFSSTDDASIEVTSGKVHVTATLTNLAAFSAEATDEAGDAGSATAFGVTSNYKYVDADKLDNNHFGFTTGGTAALENNVLTLDNIVPGDKVTLTLHIVNDSNVKIKYRVRVNVLESTNSANSLKLLEGLVVKVNGDRITNINNVNDWATTTNAGDQIDDLSIQVYLPIDAGNDYQGLSTELHFTLEAVQANAKTDELLEEINGKLKLSNQVNKTMHDAVEELSSFYNLGVLSRYLWDSKSDLFFDESTIEGFDYQYFHVYDSKPTIQTYSIYASNTWAEASVGGLTVGFDAGDATGITAVSYMRTGDNLVSREVLINTNSANTSIIINAPTDVVHHYGTAASLNIIAVAGQSYHEYGTIAFLQVSKGRVALEKDSNVSQLHFNYNTEEEKFEEIIVAVDPSVALPTLSRDQVTNIGENGTLVVELQNDTKNNENTKSDFIWLYQQGVINQIVVTETEEFDKSIKATSYEITTNTYKAANDIANNFAGGNTWASVEKDDNGNITTANAVIESGLTEQQKDQAGEVKCQHPAAYRAVDYVDNTYHNIVCSFCGKHTTEMHNYNDDCQECTVCEHANQEKVTLSHGEISTTYNVVSEAVAAYNAAKTANEPYTLTFGPGIYNLYVNQLLIIEDAAKPNKTLTIQGTMSGTDYRTVVKPVYEDNADIKAYYQSNDSNGIFCISGRSSYLGGGVIVQNLKFDLTENLWENTNDKKNVRIFAVYCLTGGSGLQDQMFPENADPNAENHEDGYHRYAHSVTVQNCDFVGPGGKFASAVGANHANSQPSEITIKNCTADKLNCWFNGYLNTSATDTNRTFGLKIENCTGRDFLVVFNKINGNGTIYLKDVDVTCLYANGGSTSGEKWMCKITGSGTATFVRCTFKALANATIKSGHSYVIDRDNNGSSITVTECDFTDIANLLGVHQ